jgi:hypothetical protein
MLGLLDDQAQLWTNYSILAWIEANIWSNVDAIYNGWSENILQAYPLPVNMRLNISSWLTPEKVLTVQEHSRFSNRALFFTSKDTTSRNVRVYDAWDSTLRSYDTDSNNFISYWSPLIDTNTVWRLPNNIPYSLSNMLHYRTSANEYWRQWTWNSITPEMRTTHFWLYWRLTGQPQAVVSMFFANHPRVPVELRWETCNFNLELPRVQSCNIEEPDITWFRVEAWYVDNPNWTTNNNFIIRDSWLGDNINQCGSWSPTTTRFSMERRNYEYDSSWNPRWWMVISARVHNRSSCDAWDYSIENWTAATIRIQIDRRTNNVRRCTVNHPWEDTTWWNDFVELRNFELRAWFNRLVQVECSFNETPPSCSDPDNNVYIRATNSIGSDTTPTGAYKRCMLPTFFFTADAEADDGNPLNDRTEGIYTTAYPFEFEQCNQRIENSWGFRYEWGCGVTDNRYKDFTLEWNPWTNVEGNLIQSVSAQSIYWVSPTITWNTIRWNFNNWELNNLLDRNYYAFIDINPRPGERQRLEWNYFRLINNQPSVITLDCDENTDNTCNWNNSARSRGVSSAVWLDPRIRNERFYDLWIYRNADDFNVAFHKQEINEWSKRWTITWDWHREPLIYEVWIENPAQNTLYWLWDLDFSLLLNPRDNNFFDIVDDTYPNVWSEINIVWGNPGWYEQSISPWATRNYVWHFLMNTWLNQLADTNHWITWNTLSWTRWLGSLRFDWWLACNFDRDFEDWRVEILDNAITIQNIEIDDPDVTPTWNQHLPWDMMFFNVMVNNNNNELDFDNVFIELDFSNNDFITDTNLHLDLNDVFEIVWWSSWNVDPYYGIPLYEINWWKESCWIDGTKIICIVNETIRAETSYLVEIKALIKVVDDFYQKLKISDEEEKYWYPIIIENIRYWTPDLNIISHPVKWNVIHYGSDLDNIPAWDIRWDIIQNDINDPINRVITPMPDKWRYNFYIWMPYMEIDTRVINTTIWHFSPWDIIEFQTTVQSKSKSYIRNPVIIQQMFKEELMDFVNVDVVHMEYVAERTNFDTPNKSIDIRSRNSDTDPTNDVPASNIVTVELQNDVNWVKEAELIVDRLRFFSDGSIAAYYEGTETPETDSWWTVVINTRVMISSLKNSKRPQIGCWINETIWCVRGTGEGTNPKVDYNVWQIDLEAVWTAVDEEAEAEYRVYFPIMRSILFQRQNQSYRPTPWSNENIRWVVNDPHTEVTYRVDNFIPSSYDPSNWSWIWKARRPIAFIRLPVWVKYTPNSLRVVENLSDVAPYWNEVPLPYEPIITSRTDYTPSIDPWTNTFEGDLDWRDPNADLLPSPEEMIDEQIWNACVYGEWVYWICILWL